MSRARYYNSRVHPCKSLCSNADFFFALKKKKLSCARSNFVPSQIGMLISSALSLELSFLLGLMWPEDFSHQIEFILSRNYRLIFVSLDTIFEVIIVSQLSGYLLYYWIVFWVYCYLFYLVNQWSCNLCISLHETRIMFVNSMNSSNARSKKYTLSKKKTPNIINAMRETMISCICCVRECYLSPLSFAHAQWWLGSYCCLYLANTVFARAFYLWGSRSVTESGYPAA